MALRNVFPIIFKNLREGMGENRLQFSSSFLVYNKNIVYRNNKTDSPKIDYCFIFVLNFEEKKEKMTNHTATFPGSSKN